MIDVTSKAVAKIKETLAQQHQLQGLRLGVQGGGCSGYNYLLRFDSKQRPTDKVFEYDGAKVFVDPKSYTLLDGLTLDYEETLLQSGFVFHNPNAKHTCGCGTSFSV
jgi:iron-sulfur cluster assembly protein